jgi:hydroxymethylpyrimidine/phosphomethylpyrimidine kinase
MRQERPYVLTIAGFDPSSGAGISADIKTFEQLRVYGLAICTGYTLQSEDHFESLEWRKSDDVRKELAYILSKYEISAVKFGIVPSVDWITELAGMIRWKYKNCAIVADPVWRSSTGKIFADFSDPAALKQMLGNVTLITPNKEEIIQMARGGNAFEFAKELSAYTDVLLKGGHDTENPGRDLYFNSDLHWELGPSIPDVFPKHGSGCVLSAAITSYLAQSGMSVLQACREAKKYTETFLASNKSLLGYHAA